MSAVVLFGFDKEQNSFEIGEVENARRGALAIWSCLSKKYLKKNLNIFFGCKEVWNLVNNDSVTRSDKIVLLSTFDYCVIRKENLEELINSYIKFDKEHKGMTNLLEQVEVIKESLEEIEALGFHQNSISCEMWFNGNLKTSKHFFLFDKKMEV